MMDILRVCGAATSFLTARGAKVFRKGRKAMAKPDTFWKRVRFGLKAAEIASLRSQ